MIRREDRKLKYFLADFINALTFADSKLWRSLKFILIRPGKFSRDFVDGKRKGYMKPISLFFLANLIYFLFPLFNTFNSNLQTQIKSPSYIHSGLAKAWVNEEVAKQKITFEEYEMIYNAKTNELSKLFLITMVFFLAFFFVLIHPKQDLFADHVTVGLELMTFTILSAVQLQGILILIIHEYSEILQSEFVGEFAISLISLVLLFYFFFGVERNFYGSKKWRAVINSILCLASFTIVLYIYRALLFFITFWSI